MNTFKIQIKQDGEFADIKATPVFPFSWGELLDERLDEAYVTIYDYTEKAIKPLTEFKAILNNNATEYEKFFILAGDESVELPVGSGRYKHSVYLIERTKLLEGMLCSSITFTNSLGTKYKGDAKKQATVTEGIDPTYSLPVGFVSPIQLTYEEIPTTFPSSKDVGTYLSELVIKNSFSYASVEIVESDNFIIGGLSEEKITHIEVINGDNSIYTAKFDNSVSITPIGPLRVRYCLVFDTLTVGLVKNHCYIQLEFTNIGTFKNFRPLKPWTITDCFNRCLELAEPLFKGENPRYRLDGVEYEDGEIKWYDGTHKYRPGSIAEKYDKVYAPEFTLTQDTLREQLKVISSFIHAEPWLDENDVVMLTEYGGVKQSSAASLPYVYEGARTHINEYCTEIRSNAQNLVSSLGYAKGVMIDPGNSLYRSLRTETAYTRITEDNGIAATEKPIYEVQSVMCGLAATSDEGVATGWSITPTDITPYVFESTEYGANLSSFGGGYPYSKDYAIYYTIGQKGLRGMFYKVENAISTATFSNYSISNILAAVTGTAVKTIDNAVTANPENLVFLITYKPITNHFVSHGKQLYVSGETPYMQLYNQSENLMESQYFGENIKGVAARLGNIERERTFITKSIENIPEVGEVLDGYAISAVSVEFMPFDIKVTLGLSKDFNRISQYVGINSQKRMYEVSERQTYQRELLIKKTLVISESEPPDNEYRKIFTNLSAVSDVFNGNSSNKKISIARLQGFTRSGNQIGSSVKFPVISRALGNTVNFAFSPKDNYSAGDISEYKSDGGVSGRWQNDVRYTDYYGRVYYATVYLLGGDLSTELKDIEISAQAFDYPRGYLSSDDSIGFTGHRLRKDNREIPSYNIELEFKTTEDDIIIGSALASLTRWVNDAEQDAPVLYIFDKGGVAISKFSNYFSQEDADKSDCLGDLTQTSPDWSLSAETNNKHFSITIPTQRIDNAGWVICTPIETYTEEVENEDGEVESVTRYKGGEIILASTDASKSTDTAGTHRVLNFYIAN